MYLVVKVLCMHGSTDRFLLPGMVLSLHNCSNNSVCDILHMQCMHSLCMPCISILKVLSVHTLHFSSRHTVKLPVEEPEWGCEP